MLRPCRPAALRRGDPELPACHTLAAPCAPLPTDPCPLILSPRFNPGTSCPLWDTSAMAIA